MRYKNKYFREVLEKDLKGKELGVNIHCREDGIYVTVPPQPTYSEFIKETPQESYDIESLMNKIKNLVIDYKIDIHLEELQHKDNIKLKFKVNEIHNN